MGGLLGTLRSAATLVTNDLLSDALFDRSSGLRSTGLAERLVGGLLRPSYQPLLRSVPWLRSRLIGTRLLHRP